MEVDSWSDEKILAIVWVVAAMLSVIVGRFMKAQDVEDCDVERRAVLPAKDLITVESPAAVPEPGKRHARKRSLRSEVLMRNQADSASGPQMSDLERMRSMMHDSKDSKDAMQLMEFAKDTLLASAKSDEQRVEILGVFASSYFGIQDFKKAASTYEQQSTILGANELFEESAHAMCGVARCLRCALDGAGARMWSARARELGAAHDFFEVQGRACITIALQVTCLDM